MRLIRSPWSILLLEWGAKVSTRRMARSRSASKAARLKAMSVPERKEARAKVAMCKLESHKVMRITYTKNLSRKEGILLGQIQIGLLLVQMMETMQRERIIRIDL